MGHPTLLYRDLRLNERYCLDSAGYTYMKDFMVQVGDEYWTSRNAIFFMD